MAFAFLPFPILSQLTLPLQAGLFCWAAGLSYFVRPIRWTILALLALWTLYLLSVYSLRWGLPTLKSTAWGAFYIFYFMQGVNYILECLSFLLHLPGELQKYFHSHSPPRPSAFASSSSSSSSSSRYYYQQPGGTRSAGGTGERFWMDGEGNFHYHHHDTTGADAPPGGPRFTANEGRSQQSGRTRKGKKKRS